MDITPLRVLLVEDNPGDARLIQIMLTEQEDGSFHVDIAPRLADALAAIEKDAPDAILVDLNLPDSSGLGTAERVIAAAPNVPVLVMTGLEDERVGLEAMRHGVQDYLTKGQIDGPLIRRAVRYAVDRMKTQALLAEKVDELTTLTERIRDELEAAQSLQLSLLPTEEELKRFADSYSLEIVGHFQPSSELSGDLWAAMPLTDWRVGIFLADLTGHGVSAAINAFRLHSLIDPTPPFANDVTEFMDFLAARLKALLPTGQFAAGLYAIVDPVESTLTCAGAAIQPPILVPAPGAEAQFIEARGLPLGVVDKPTYKIHCNDFGPGAVLLCYSDALVETPDKSGEPITPEEVLEWVSEAATAGADIVETVWETAIDRLGTQLPDDLTLVSVRRIDKQ